MALEFLHFYAFSFYLLYICKFSYHAFGLFQWNTRLAWRDKCFLFNGIRWPLFYFFKNRSPPELLPVLGLLVVCVDWFEEPLCIGHNSQITDHMIQITCYMLNRLSFMNGNVPLDWLNMSLSTFKINCKKKFLIM